VTTSRTGAPTGALTPYICPRDAARAISWYAQVLGAEEVGERYAGSGGGVGHATLLLAGEQLFVSDSAPDHGVQAPDEDSPTVSFSLHLEVTDVDELTRRAEQAGARVQAPPVDEPYGRVSKILDPFGVRWMLSGPVSAGSGEPR
jgi:PhnB protein